MIIKEEIIGQKAEQKTEKLKDKKDKYEKIKPQEKQSAYEVFKQNKSAFYCCLFYAAGLLLGALLLKKTGTDSSAQIILSLSQGDFSRLLVNNLGFYFLVFSLTLFLGICLIGFPIINAVPLIIGFQTGAQVAFYYLEYGIKGFGFSLLMIAPFTAAFLTIIINTASLSSQLSKKIYEITRGKDKGDGIEYRDYMKKYILYALMTVLAAVINAGITAALRGIISL